MSLKVFVIFIPRAFNIIYLFTNISIDVPSTLFPLQPHLLQVLISVSSCNTFPQDLPKSNENKPFTHQVAKN